MINRLLFTYLPSFRKLLTRFSYEYVSYVDRDAHLHFCNYGYAPLNSEPEPLPLIPHEQKQLYEVQLYDHIATTVPINWHGLDVLEVSSGRGGGACYIKRCFRPASVVGVDFCQRAVDFCREQYALEGLSFIRGDAQALDFADNSFDVVINIEASFYYPKIERFFSSVVRILRPNGYFLYADMRYTNEVEKWQGQLQRMGLRLLSEEDITANVVHALALDQERRTRLVNTYAHWFLRRSFNQFAGGTGGDLAGGSMVGRKRIYKIFVFYKESG